MTIANEISQSGPYTGNGVTTAFPFMFKIVDQADLKVLRIAPDGTEVTLALGSGYSVTGVGASSGNVVTNSPPASGDKIWILLDPTLTQTTQLESQGAYLAKSVEDRLDRTVNQIKAVKREVGRSIKAGLGQEGLTFPASDGVGLIGWDGDDLVNRPSEAASAAVAEAAAEAAVAAAASVNLPLIVANRMLVDNEDGTARESKSFAEVVDLLGLGVGSAVNNRAIETINPVDPDFGAAGGTADDILPIQDAWLAGADSKALVAINEPLRASGYLLTTSDLHVRAAPGAWLKQTRRSSTGGFISNVADVAEDREQSNVILENMQIDGELLPDPEYHSIVSGTTTTVVLPSGASSVDDFYKGAWFQFLEGTRLGNSGTVASYVGSTKTVTFASALGGSPSAGDDIVFGSNENAMGFARGMSNLRIRGGVIKNYPMEKMVPAALGGKGVNFEQECYDCIADGLSIKNVYTGFYLSGHAGEFSPGHPRSVIGSQVHNSHAEDCGSLLTIGNLDLADGIPADVDQLQVIASGLTFKNCGHAPYRIVSVEGQKSGVINLMGANGATVTNIRGYNEAGYPASYPTDYPARCGYGLSGPVGAVVWGHARNTTLSNIHYGGDADVAVHMGRVRALGDDAPSAGVVSGCFGWDIDGLYVYGTLGMVIRRDAARPMSGNEISGYWRFVIDSVTTGLVDTNLSGFTLLTLDITERGTGKRVIGTPSQILRHGNAFANYAAGTTDLRDHDRSTVVIADDTAISFTPQNSDGILLISTSSGARRGIVEYRTVTSASCSFIGSTPAGMTATTGALAGTTGTDGQLTVSADVTTGKIYIENRAGGTLTARWATVV